MSTRPARQNTSTSAASKLTAAVDASKGENESVLASMQQSLEKAMKEMGRVGKLLTTLQTDISDIKKRYQCGAAVFCSD